MHSGQKGMEQSWRREKREREIRVGEFTVISRNIFAIKK